MHTIDFTQHNEEVQQVWDAYLLGDPLRVPVGNFTIGPRIWLLDRRTTPRHHLGGVQYGPELMFQVLLQYKYHLHHHVVHDIEMGIPAAGWEVFVEFCNVTEAAWLGCELHYPPQQVSATTPRYAGERKNEIFAHGMPDPFAGIYATVKEYYEYFLARALDYEFFGKPVKVALPNTGLGTDGPLTVALDIRGEETLATCTWTRTITIN